MGKILQFFTAGKDLREKDSREFEAKLKPHVEMLFKLGWRFSGNKDDAEDLVQGFLLKLYTRQHKLEEVEDLKPWLGRSFYNYFVSEYRKSKRDPLKFADEVEDHDAMDALVNDADPYVEQEQASTEKSVMALVQQLPLEQRTIVVMHDMEGYALHEIAEISQIPLGTVKSRLCRAREKLKKLLQTEPWKDLLRDEQ